MQKRLLQKLNETNKFYRNLRKLCGKQQKRSTKV